MIKTILPIKGMHCRSCEILIEEKLKEIPGLSNIKVGYKEKTAVIYSQNQPNLEKIKLAIYDAGYEVGSDEKAWISKNPADYKDIVLSIVILILLYLIAKYFGIINFSAGNSNNPTGLLVVLIVGLTAGVSTCMALVGGLVLGISARHSEKHPEATPLQNFRPHLFFNLGRILSFALLGGLIGLIGKAFQLSSPMLGFLTIAVGFVMIILGIQLTELFPRISSASFTLPSGIAKIFGIKKKHNQEYSHWNSVFVGALTFFLPCGFTQAMQLYAMSTGNFFAGAAIMGVFALGTAPGLLSIGGLTSIIKGAFAKKFFKFAGLLVITLAIVNISNGYNLTGIRIFSSKISSVSSYNDPNVKIVDGYQIVKMEQNTRGYNPNKFTIQKDIPTEWEIKANDTNSCSGSLVAPKIKVKQFLKPGINTISFTPTEVGEIKFSCSMGMYTGKFIVVEKKSEIALNPTTSPSPTPSSSPFATSSVSGEVQIIKTTYISGPEDINPKEFTVEVNRPVRFEISSEQDAGGCMSTITVPGLVDSPQFLEKDKTIIFEFTPKEKGSYYITCAMGSPRGLITVK